MTTPIDLRALRLRRGLTQAALARACGLSQQHLSRLERDPVRAEVATLRKILGALDCELAVVSTRPSKDLAERRRRWDAFEASARPWETRRPSPADALRRVDELAAAFAARNPRPVPDWPRRAAELRLWRARLAALRP